MRCSGCPFVANTPAEMEYHLYHRHLLPFYCHSCPFHTFRRQEIEEHVWRYHSQPTQPTQSTQPEEEPKPEEKHPETKAILISDTEEESESESESESEDEEVVIEKKMSYSKFSESIQLFMVAGIIHTSPELKRATLNRIRKLCKKYIISLRV